jgi:hypothetical protein
MDELKTVTYKQIGSILGVCRSTAYKMAIKTRMHYKKEKFDSITLGQVLKANNLEK